MNTKTILSLFIVLVLTTISSLIFMVVVGIKLINSPTKVYYTYNYKDTYNITYNAPKEPVKTTKPKVVKKKPKKVEKPKQTSGYSDSEVYLLAKIINAEAKGEPYRGKVAVGNVILNRVKSSKFPDTIKGVIYQPRQFQPVSNGKINNVPSAESVKAAKESLSTNLIGNALYFYNPDIATDSWIRTRQITTTIGNHSFAI